LIFFGLFTIAFLLMGAVTPLAFIGLFFLLSLGLTHSIVKTVDVPVGVDRKDSLFLQLKVFCIANLVLLAVGISSPFFSHTSSYKKVDE